MHFSAPRAGIEPATLCLTGTCSAAELPRKDASFLSTPRRGDRMTVCAKEGQIGKPVVGVVSIQMFYLERCRLPAPFCDSTVMAAILPQTSPDKAFSDYGASAVSSCHKVSVTPLDIAYPIPSLRTAARRGR